MLKKDCKKYLEWCKKYFYKPNTYVALKAYYKLNKGVGAGSTLA